ncbi:hypothetical protein [Roseimicrobium sp. ORNL1]|uniref:hypothetical protein n=1 Tax=Roseimicrobium sp. ORNL1 TaxID=2711231 RepID=UPI0013E0F051|nr:hypothetical protein [Roseimicrobium sp. ORNL1]QIF02813.1 hypothetical protein G5S37_15205 [Roseimicrobium sp. ORNL1]
MPLETRYITVDLVVKGSGGTCLLVAALEAKNYVVQKHDWNAGNLWLLNIGCPRDFDEPEPCIIKYCEDLESIPTEARAEWAGANFREFSIGYETGGQPTCFEQHLKPETLARVVGLGLGIGIVLYPIKHESPGV